MCKYSSRHAVFTSQINTNKDIQKKPNVSWQDRSILFLGLTRTNTLCCEYPWVGSVEFITCTFVSHTSSKIWSFGLFWQFYCMGFDSLKVLENILSWHLEFQGYDTQTCRHYNEVCWGVGSPMYLPIHINRIPTDILLQRSVVFTFEKRSCFCFFHPINFFFQIEQTAPCLLFFSL